MRKLILLIAAFTTVSLTASAQKSMDVSTKVKTAFTQMFPTATHIKWDKESKSEWEAEFKMAGKEYSANFDMDGNWKETEYEISSTAIPTVVRITLDKEFAGYKIKESEISETAKGKVYEFALKNGYKTVEAVIAPNGKVLNKEVKNEKDEEDND